MNAYSKLQGYESTQSAAANHVGRSGKSRRGSHAAPVQKLDEEEELQMKRASQAQQVSAPLSESGGRSPGIPASVQTKMERVLGTDLSGVTVHANSSKATGVGALAYTQGTDIHVAPGQYSPGTSAGKRLLGHELAHVAQQMAGRVQPTGEVGGLPLNDSPALESEADSLGSKAV